MSTWKDTPFKDIAEAHDTAYSFGLNPTEITLALNGRFDSFIIYEGRTTVYMAQAVEGGPVREKIIKSKRRVRDPRIPTFKEEDRLLVGPWVRTDYGSYKEVEDYLRKQIINYDDNVERLRILLIRLDDDETEYFLDSLGVMHCRVLHKRK